MKRKILLSLITGLLLTGCTFKTSNTAMMIDGSKTDYTQLDQMKKGEACFTTVFGIPVDTDKRISTAVKRGEIDKIMHVDERVDSFGIFKHSNCTVVYGI